MKYKGIELKEFTSNKPIVFDKPRKMLCWETDDAIDRSNEMTVYAYLPERPSPVIGHTGSWKHCAEIPEEPKSRRATNRELAKWLAKGNGESLFTLSKSVHPEFGYNAAEANDVCPSTYRVRKWEDDEWHEPTAGYMGLED